MFIITHYSAILYWPKYALFNQTNYYLFLDFIDIRQNGGIVKICMWEKLFVGEGSFLIIISH